MRDPPLNICTTVGSFYTQVASQVRPKAPPQNMYNAAAGQLTHTLLALVKHLDDL